MQQASRNVFKRINKMSLLFVKKKVYEERKCYKKILINKIVNKVEYSRVNVFYKVKRFCLQI